ncbi:MAG: sortase [Clostridiales bacterium]|jgi:sortase A|nr:sortase [Clostridiales bacterium]
MKKRAAFLIGTGCVLIAVSASLAVNNQLESLKAEKSAELLTEAFISRTTVFETSVTEMTNEPVPEIIADNEIRGADEQASAKKPIIIDGQEFIGLLSIPSLGVSLPVNNDISYPLLKMTPCRYFGSVDSDSLIIAAHNYNSHFGKIGMLKPGDRVNFTNAGGLIETYAIAEVLTLPGDAVDEMIKPEGWALTLFTCTYSGTERITVRCVKEERI